MAQTKRCPNCGASNPETAEWCSLCLERFVDRGFGRRAGAVGLAARLEDQARTYPVAYSAFEAPDLSLTERILFGAFIFGIIGLFTVLGVLTPGMGWFMYLFLIPFYAMFPIAILGLQGALILLVIYLVVFPIAKVVVSRTSWYETSGSARFGKNNNRVRLPLVLSESSAEADMPPNPDVLDGPGCRRPARCRSPDRRGRRSSRPGVGGGA